MNFISKDFKFNKTDKPVLIGEIGVNHNKDRDLLFELINQGVQSGVDIIKFQRFNASLEISTFANKTSYQKKTSTEKSQLDLAKKLELPDKWLIDAFEYCKSKNIGFLCTGFEYESVDFISETLGCTSIKVPSPDITNLPLLRYIASKFEGVILSTGASNLEECITAAKIFENNELIVLHCLSEYPAPINEINLRAMKTLENTLKKPIGYSDHTEGFIVPIIAAAMGAVAIEKHYTLDKNYIGPDHKASADIDELKKISKSLDLVFKSMGSGEKKIASSEEKNINLIRKSITCAKNHLKKGSIIESDMLGIKRPVFENSIEPYDFEKIIGKTLNKEKFYDEPIFWTDID